MEATGKLVIGTAQFGQHYGITNKSGKVNKSEIGLIFKKARANQVDTLDTASSYGNSERVLGLLGVSDFNIITKLPLFDSIPSDIQKVYEKAMRSSLERLNLSSVDTVLLHRPEDLLGAHGERIFEALKNLKEKGLTSKIGISIYAPDILDQIYDKFFFDVIQAPINVFDRRIISSGWLDKLFDMNVTTIARSIFLQGILLSEISSLPSYFHNWMPELLNWQKFCKANNISLMQGCLHFVGNNPQIEKIIVGVVSESQFQEVLTAANQPVDFDPVDLESKELGLISPLYWRA
ncbi:aldo/keto reductase [Paracoccaceae bacterium]|nr:aldo/keto reductase [Paracoccaceae bacterium]